MPKVSIIIPFYNVAPYFEECLSSVVNQTYRNLEIILVDDCGNDCSLDIAQKFAKNDSRIKLLKHSKNKGLAEARNTGLLQATGEYIFFLDSDDYLELNIIEELYRKIRLTKSDIVFSQSQAFTVDGDKDVLKRVVELNRWLRVPIVENEQVSVSNFSQFIADFPCTAWGKLYNKKFLEKYGIRYIKGNFVYEDNGFFLKLASQFPNISSITACGVNYRIRNNSITTNPTSGWNTKKKSSHMKANLLDAFKYIKGYAPRSFCNTIINLIRNSSIYCEYFTICNPFFKFVWQLNDKKIYILGIPFLREKRKNSQYKVCKVLGFPIYKIPLEVEEHVVVRNQKMATTKQSVFAVQAPNKIITEVLHSLNNPIFCPVSGNLGDIVIATSEFQYLDSANINYTVCNLDEYIFAKSSFDLIYGGGDWTELYKNNYPNILNLFSNKNLNKCVILPSSFNDCGDLLDILDERFIVFCRDKYSYNYCKLHNTKAQFYLADDMVMYVDVNDLYRSHCDEGEEVFFTLNADLERLYIQYYSVYLQYRRLKLYAENERVAYCFRKNKESVIQASSYPSIEPLGFIWECGRDVAFDNILTKAFLSIIDLYDVVITDRLHVALCAMKLEKQVYLLDNNFGQISSVYEYSFQKFNNVHLISQADLKALDIHKLSQSEDPLSSPKLGRFFMPETYADFVKEYKKYDKNKNTQGECKND